MAIPRYNVEDYASRRAWAQAIFAEVYAEANESTIDAVPPPVDNGPMPQNADDLSFEELERLTTPGGN